MKWLCRLFWHIPVSIDVKTRTAICHRCGRKLRVAYDGTYGDTIVEGVIEEAES